MAARCELRPVGARCGHHPQRSCAAPTVPYGIKGVEGSLQEANPEEVKGLGDHPILARVRLDDDSFIQVALAEVHPELAPEKFQAGTQ